MRSRKFLTPSNATATRRRGSTACSIRSSARPAPTSPADYSIADIACFPWTMTHKAQGFTLDDYPNVKRWYAVVRARPQVQAGLAIGKFVKEPFDEEARKNMFGQAAILTSPRLRGEKRRVRGTSALISTGLPLTPILSPQRAGRGSNKTKRKPHDRSSSSTVPVPGPISPSTTSSRWRRNSASTSVGGRSWSAASSTPSTPASTRRARRRCR